MLTLEGASCGTLLRHVPRRGQIMSISIFEFYRQMTWWWFLLNNKFILQRNPFFQWHITVPDVPLFNEQELMVPCNSHLNILLELPRGYEPNVWRITGRKLGFGNRVHNHVKTRALQTFTSWTEVMYVHDMKSSARGWLWVSLTSQETGVSHAPYKGTTWQRVPLTNGAEHLNSTRARLDKESPWPTVLNTLTLRGRDLPKSPPDQRELTNTLKQDKGTTWKGPS
jgi:hypothetical protein